MSERRRRILRRGVVVAMAGVATFLGLSLAFPALGLRVLERPQVPAAAAQSDVIQFAQQLAAQLRRPAEETPAPAPPAPPAAQAPAGEDLSRQSVADVEKKNTGCVSCHTETDAKNAHTTESVKAACIDCHGGRGEVMRPAGSNQGAPGYEAAKRQAHVLPKYPEHWKTSANPVRNYTHALRESVEFIRFINPGDLRAARLGCGQNGCHTTEVQQVRKSMMATAPMLWAAALYNNGSFPLKIPRFGEVYGEDGHPAGLYTIPPPTPEEISKKGVVPFIEPLPRFEVGQPSNLLRVFERGQEKALDIGLPELDELPGRPANRLSPRGYGTNNRTDPVWLNLQRTRLLNPTLGLMGTNDHPGDYRASGCSACHVIYANDRSPVHSAQYAEFGNRGLTVTKDPTIPKNESGHPIKHMMTNSIPSSQCVVCHMHPGTTVTNTYFGYTWWDNETDGELLYYDKLPKRTSWELDEILKSNPEGSGPRGRWSDPEFLANVTDLNAKAKHTRFADFHGHGWLFRAVFKRDHKGNLLDEKGKIVPFDDPQWDKKAVHLKDIHLEKGMHCVDCHFQQDAHGNGKLYGEVRAAVEIQCTDCHGTIQERATLKTSGPAAPEGGTDLSALRTPFGSRRFQFQGDTLIQRSMVTKDLQWEVVQVPDSIDPNSDWAKKNAERSAKSRLAKTMRRDGTTWGDAVSKQEEAKALAHADSRMTCQSCHTSWVTSCFGCHLPMKANQRRPLLHFEGDTTRNWTSYSFQTLRDDVFMLAVDGNVMNNKISPARSTCAVLVGSQNGNREWVYSQQQTVSAEGFSGHAFSTFVPHTVRSTETKTCTDCHVSRQNNNNALMAALTMQGTNFYNFLGRFIYVAEGKHGLESIVVSEREEPQAVIGSSLHKVAYPDAYAAHEKRNRLLKEAYHHRGRDVLDFLGRDEVLSIQLRGEYLYTANGSGGFRAYDVAQIDQKGFSERIVTAPFSPLGQRLYVKTKYATAVASPTTLGVDPTRTQRPENQEQKIHLAYAFLYVTDKYEGLVVVGNPLDSPNRAGIATLLDGDPNNNFLERALTFNPDGILNGAVNLTIAGTYAYILADRGLIIVSLEDPLKPKVLGTVGSPHIVGPRSVAVQFRYAFITDREGLKVVDITSPERPRPVPEAAVKLEDAKGIYLVRTYAYVAGGRQGLVIVDIERPEKPVIDQVFNAGGALNDAHDVKVGATNASLFAYVADGKNGLRVLQITNPDETPGYLGFSPRVKPQLVATYKTEGHALAISKGTDRDRAVDESGNQLSVFNRLGSRPFNRAEMERLYLRDGKVYTVSDEAPSSPRPPAVIKKKEEEPAEEPGRLRRGR